MTNAIQNTQGLEGEVVTGVAAAKDEALISLQGLAPSADVLFRVFSSLAKEGINVDIITQSVHESASKTVSIDFTVNSADLLTAQSHLAVAFPEARVSTRNDVAKVSIVGVGMRTHAGVAARMFEVFAKNAIEVLLVTTSEIKVACLVERSKADSAVCALHKEFLES